MIKVYHKSLAQTTLSISKEDEAAELLRQKLEEDFSSYPNAKGNLYILTSIRIFGQKRNDIDMLIIGFFENFVIKNLRTKNYGEVKELSLKSIICNIELKSHSSSSVKHEGTDHCWRGQFLNYFAPHGQLTSFCVAECSDNRMTEPVRDIVRSIKGWTNEVLHIKNPFANSGLYPLAYIDGRLYFTNNPNHITLNDKWGNGTIYYIHTNNFAATADFIDTSVEESTTKIFKLSDGDPMNIKTSGLGALIKSKSGHLIEGFIEHCKAHADETVKVCYQDEHMKSIMSIILTLQTVRYFIKEMGNSFSMEFKLERYDTDSGKWDSVTANIPSSYSKEDGRVGRDGWIETLANSWIDDLDYEDNIEGTLIPVCSQPKNALTHWRVLSFDCAGKRLSIYPDVGLMNGWSIYNAPSQFHRYDTATITHDTEIDLHHNQEIKFDVTIEEY